MKTMIESKRRVVVVGASVAGTTVAKSLRSQGFEGSISLVSDEDCLPYNRPPLSKEFLSGAVNESDISLLTEDDLGKLCIDYVRGDGASFLTPELSRVRLRSGEELPYDALVIATGAAPRTLGNSEEKPFRSLEDARRVRKELEPGRDLVVVGSGFIGAEVASSARSLGAAVTVIEAQKNPFAAGLGPVVGGVLLEAHELNGVELISGSGVGDVRRLASGRSLVRLANGETREADTVVIGVGVTPNTAWLRKSGIDIQDGILTTPTCEVVGFPGIWAVGDVARWTAPNGTAHREEHWTNAVNQAELVASNIAEPRNQQTYSPRPYFWSDQYDLRLQLIGKPNPSLRAEELFPPLSGDPRRVFAYIDSDRVIAVAIFNWPKAALLARRPEMKNLDLPRFRQKMDQIR